MFISIDFQWINSWANNCAANDATNGVDLKVATGFIAPRRKQPKGVIIDKSKLQAVGLPLQFQPNLTLLPGNDDAMMSYILPDKKTGVVSSMFTFNYIRF